MIRDNSIDIAKGIGIFLVVWGHTFEACPIRREIYFFHMPLFFFLAGCFVRKDNIKVVFYKRMRTLLVPFAFFYVASLIIKLGKAMSSNPLLDTILNFDFSLTNVNYVLWFIPALFLSSIIFHLCVNRISGGVKLSIAVLSVSLIGYVLCYYNVNFFDVLYLPQALCVTVFLLLGNIYHRVENKQRTLCISLLFCLPFFIFSIIANKAEVDIAVKVVGSNYLLFVVNAIFGISLTLLFSNMISKYKISIILENLGLYSLFIYGFHANSKILNPIILQSMHILGYEGDTALLSSNIIYGFVKTFYCLLIFFVIGYILKRYIPYFFGYSKEDKILKKLKTNNE